MKKERLVAAPHTFMLSVLLMTGAFAGGTAVRYEKAPPIRVGLCCVSRRERGVLSAQDPIWERWDP